MSTKDEKKYDEAMAELKEILQAMQQQGAMSMTEYAEKARRAKELIGFCKKFLDVMDEKLQEIVKTE